MGVQYFNKINTATSFGSSLKLLIIYRGGLLQHLWRSFVIYVVLYLGLGLLYSHVLATNRTAKFWFEYVCRLCDSNVIDIPLTLVLGFYVTQVVNRWWSIYQCLAWPDRLCMKLSCHAPNSNAPGGDADPARTKTLRVCRRRVARYASAASVLTLRAMSSRVIKRFPGMVTMEAAGILTGEERVILEKMEAQTKNKFGLYWMPCVWIEEVLNHMFKESMFSSALGYVDVVHEAQRFNSLNAALVGYAWNNFPLPYVQLATLSVYSYLLVLLLGAQVLSPDEESRTLLGWREEDQLRHQGGGGAGVMPLVTMLQFVIYAGWFKVAETLLNPLGEDVNDFDMNTFVDRNIAASLIMVDAEGQGFSCLRQDAQRDHVDPFDLGIPLGYPHTPSSALIAKTENPVPTAKKMIESVLKEDDGDSLRHSVAEFFSEGPHNHHVRHRKGGDSWRDLQSLKAARREDNLRRAMHERQRRLSEGEATAATDFKLKMEGGDQE